MAQLLVATLLTEHLVAISGDFHIICGFGGHASHYIIHKPCVQASLLTSFVCY